MPETTLLPNGDEMPSLHEETFAVQYHETDQYGFVRLVALLNYLQTSGVKHASLLKVAVSDLRKGGNTWVLSRVHLTMDRYPRGGDTIRVRTWVASKTPYFTVRDYELYNTAGNIIGRATTSWAVLNMKSRKPVKLSEALPEFPMNPTRAINDEFGTLPVLDNSQKDLLLPVLRGDLDSNRHVNNTVYAAWALETIPEEVDRTSRLTEFEIAFRSEALYGETIIAKLANGETDDCYIHRIESCSDGRELARLRTRWSRLE